MCVKDIIFYFLKPQTPNLKPQTPNFKPFPLSQSLFLIESFGNASEDR